MVKAKICLDTGCTKYILLDDGRCIETPREKCEPKSWNDKERKDWESIVRETSEAIKVNRPVLKNTKVGDEVDL